MSAIKKIQLPNNTTYDVNDSRISVSSPTNGQVLTYDSSTGLFVNSDPSGGGGTTSPSSYTNVLDPGGYPADGGVITYFEESEYQDYIQTCDNSYTACLMDDSMYTDYGDTYVFPLYFPNFTDNPYVGGEKIHYIMFVNDSNYAMTVTPDLSSLIGYTVKIIGDLSTVTIESGQAVEYSIKQLYGIWVITHSSLLPVTTN